MTLTASDKTASTIIILGTLHINHPVQSDRCYEVRIVTNSQSARLSKPMDQRCHVQARHELCPSARVDVTSAQFAVMQRTIRPDDRERCCLAFLKTHVPYDYVGVPPTTKRSRLTAVRGGRARYRLNERCT